MRQFVFYFVLGLLFVFLQSSVFPLFLEPNLRPSPLLILVVFAGLKEDLLGSIIAGLLLGAIQDSFSGHSLGLYVTVYLALALCAEALSEQLNAESPPLLMLLIAGGTLVQNLLVGVLLSLLADTPSVLSIILSAIPMQILANLLFALVLLFLLLRVQRWFGYKRGLAGLIYQGKHHGA